MLRRMKSAANLEEAFAVYLEEMNRCGILVDISHAGHRTSLDIAGVLFVLGSGAVLVSRLRESFGMTT